MGLQTMLLCPVKVARQTQVGLAQFGSEDALVCFGGGSEAGVTKTLSKRFFGGFPANNAVDLALKTKLYGLPQQRAQFNGILIQPKGIGHFLVQEAALHFQ
jgi:hypothetical protein